MHEVLITKHAHDMVARMYRVSATLVHTLVMKAKKNPKYLEELKGEMEAKETEVEAIQCETE